MTPSEYQQFVESTWTGSREQVVADPQWLRDLFIMSTGLGGETGEVLEKLKKYVRDGTLDYDGLKKELGDVLYYLTRIAAAFGHSLDDVIQANVDKLNSRRSRGVMRGSGDNR